MRKRGRSLKTTMRNRLADRFGVGPPWRRFDICIMGDAADDWWRLFGCNPPGSWKVIGASAVHAVGERQVWVNGREVPPDSVRIISIT